MSDTFFISGAHCKALPVRDLFPLESASLPLFTIPVDEKIAYSQLSVLLNPSEAVLVECMSTSSNYSNYKNCRSFDNIRVMEMGILPASDHDCLFRRLRILLRSE